MKKQIFLLAALLMTGVAVQAQVGVGTDDPKATMEIVGETTANVPDGVLIPRFTVTELAAKDAAYGADQTGALVFVTSGVGAAGKTSNITGPGFHYYDNATSKWVAVGGSGGGPEVDGIIGNEVLNATTNRGLVRSGSGTTVDPYTLGMIAGTAPGQIMEWNGTAWVAVAPSASGVFNVTAEIAGNYTVLADDGFVRLNINSPGFTLTLPIIGIPVGKVVYFSNIGSSGMALLPALRNGATPTIEAGSTGTLVYLGGGIWDMASGY